jgi:myosin heavy subunit
MYARDALSKALYGALFNWIVEKINETLEKPSKEEDELDQDEEEEKKKKGHNMEGYIGVLDIFGFESFEVNGLEQLLINFANEALQDTFNKKVSNIHFIHMNLYVSFYFQIFSLHISMKSRNQIYGLYSHLLFF